MHFLKLFLKNLQKFKEFFSNKWFKVKKQTFLQMDENRIDKEKRGQAIFPMQILGYHFNIKCVIKFIGIHRFHRKNS